MDVRQERISERIGEQPLNALLAHIMENDEDP